jgi:YD repeat-containing protein
MENIGNIGAYKIQTALIDAIDWNGDITNYYEYFIGKYDVSYNWVAPKSKTVYDYSGDDVLEQTTNYYYNDDDYRLLNETETSDSEGNVISTKHYYASDYPDDTETTDDTFDEMVSDYIISPVIKKETFNGTTQTGGLIANYYIDDYDHVVISNIQDYNTVSDTYETRVECTDFGEYGNIQEFEKNDGISTAYIWSYNNQYPVIKAENVDYDTLLDAVESAAGTTDLETYWADLGDITTDNTTWNTFNETLRKDESLSDVLISTYTYEPLIGMTSHTDPTGRTSYYDYDDFGRLEYIRNQDYNIVKKLVYNYANSNSDEAETVASTLSLSDTSIKFTSLTDTEEITVESNTTWTVSTNSDWIVVSETSGSGDGSFTIYVTSCSDYDSCIGIITVTTSDGTVEAYISIIELILNKSEIELETRF